MTSLAWKLNRLCAMGPAEIGHRVRGAARTHLARLGLGLSREVPAPGDACVTGRPWLSVPGTISPQPYVAAAEAVLAGRFDVFALRGASLGFPPDWNRDPKTCTDALMTLGITLDYRDESKVGDVKYLWEINRHLELVTLAQAWALTREPRYAEACRALVGSWLEQCPYPRGPNWTSALEHGIRLTNWSAAWQLLDADDSPCFRGTAGTAFRRRWLDSVFRHCQFIAAHLSRYSSANNHLLGELMGLLIAALSWPLWPQSERWRDMARRGLEEEALKQNAPDGTNREQAVWYHHEVADMMLLCGLVGRANGIVFSPAYWQRLQAMLEFVAGLVDLDGNVPMIGDADDAVMLRLCPVPGLSVYRSLLATGAVLFARSDFKAKACAFDDKGRWLLGTAGEAAYAALPEAPAQPLHRAFPDGGYWILGKDFGREREVRVLVDGGPLGYLSIAAHGHADALALWLSIGGKELLVDPGTYAYHTQAQWRAYFRGTSAHNTVRVDGVDQSVSGGSFLWTRHARARCVAWEPGPERDRWVGEHDGYTRLKDPVTHRREVLLEKEADRLLVRDILECRGPHHVERFWHLAEDCSVEVNGSDAVVRKGAVTLQIRSRGTASMATALVTGREDPPLGWVSRRFDVRRPTSTLVLTDTAAGSTVLETEIGWRFSP